LKVLIERPESTTAEFVIWAGVNMVVCGYYVNTIQKEKREKIEDQKTEE